MSFSSLVYLLTKYMPASRFFSHLADLKFSAFLAVTILMGGLTGTVWGQTPLSLSDLGSTAPVPGANDIAQLSTTGNTAPPDNLNYYTDNQTEHNSGEPGQTFTTGNNPGGYTLNALAIRSAGLNAGGGSPGTSINYLLHLYTVSGGTATPMAAYTSSSPIVYTDGDWLLWSGIATNLSPNTTYAYSFGKAAAANGWDAMAVASGNPYAGGEIGLIPPAGGAITFGASHGYDANFVAKLSLGGLVVTLPAVTNFPATGITTSSATVNGQVLASGGQTPVITFYYGTSNGGTNAANWQSKVSLGNQSSAYSATLLNLATNTTYYFTANASNSAGSAWAAPSLSFATLATNPPLLMSSVVTYHYDNQRTGANTNEQLLAPGNVSVNTFGKLFSQTVDGYIYAEPLVMTNVTVPGLGTHNIVFVATEHDSLYAFDADSNQGPNGGLLWYTNLGISAVTPNNDFGNRYGAYHDLTPEMGITGTPVIDPVSGTIYLDVFTHEGTNYFHRIHALDITSGHERPYSPGLVTATVPGRGVSSSAGTLVFNAQQHLQRPALTLAGGKLYVAYSSYADTDPYHGWVIGFNATNLVALTNYVFNTTPNATVNDFGANAGEGGLWMTGNGLSVDTATNLYFEVANGSFSQNTNGGDYGDSFVKLSTVNALTAADYFTPNNQAALQSADQDLGSGGPLLLPDSVGSTAHPHLIVGAGKEGTIYLVDRDNMGHYNAANNNQIVQVLPGAIGASFSSPAYFNHLIFYQGDGDVMKAFSIANASINSTPVSSSGTSFGTAATPVISSAGANNAIAWAIQSDAYSSSGPSVLHAYNATNLSTELYNSSQNLARDNPGAAVKFTLPTVVNGKVYVGAQYKVSVYGNATFVATPLITPSGGVFTNSTTVSLSDTTGGASIYYTLDGATPTTNSLLYTSAFVVSNTTSVHAWATAPGAISSGVASAGFYNSSAVGSGVGLSGAYYTNHTSLAPYTGLPTLVRTDAVMNFNWNTVGPDPTVGQTSFTVKWTGCVQPQFNDTYTFYATADDGVRLWVNGQEIINEWIDEAPTTYSASVPLKAQQLYNIEMDYYQGGGGAEASLAWSSSFASQSIIPSTQLYPYTNPPPTVILASPANNTTNLASASVTITAQADAPYNPVTQVSFYANASYLGSISNAPYTLTATRLAAGNYSLTAVATDGSGLTSTSAPVNLTVLPGTGQPYGLTNRSALTPFLGMPTTFNGTLPPLLSQTGVFSNTPSMTPAAGLIPYQPNVALWSDGALKTRYLAVPNNGSVITPEQQITYAPTGSWTFPAGTLFVKTFELNTDQSNPAVKRRLETRLLVADINGAVYGVTYKWRPDNSEADLLATSLTEAIAITNSTGVTTQTWYYPSPADCLTCHTPVANYVLGLSTRQLNGNLTYPATAVTDNQLRTLNQLGLFYPAFNESALGALEKLSALTNLTASLQERSRSYLDANCAQCHQPGGSGTTFDARYDTPLTNQNIINALPLGNLGYDHAHVVTPKDVWRSVLYDRINTTNDLIKMPPLARNLIDTNAVAIIGTWINSLPGVPALAPPVISPNGGNYTFSVGVTLQGTDPNETIYYTLDGTLPTTNSLLYSSPIVLTNSVTLTANAFETNYNNSVATAADFFLQPGLYFNTPPLFTNNLLQLGFSTAPGSNYVLEATTNFTAWIPLQTNLATTNQLQLFDFGATNYPYRFYRIHQQ